ncbi:hypothetical protein PF005_g18001 [Phytophthora fragariae]|uniref:Uncharacterized protein n=1 Tax=Phytophthora fragariae TaxID=53985 RepID=A0A6A3K3M8_9STRA|nr:hypothetical protein PF003_g19106 [Phytophthora fragariae]KAE8930607.1 hypothetical protein PF009_g19306 [Phytophthora fragariae]KAE9001769.1 hypothetical protein PF011_g13607 [Phytophthora fragariae]KAE9094323.1 hypothetical protein PF007_g17802 [Phytophthora fragariae]KAE9107688.1 hypothetical protein PF010_g12186 [Phytophthora fragariae]
MNGGFWTILNDAFGGRVGISGDVLLDSTVDDDEEEEEAREAANKEDTGTKPKPPPVAQLATALQGGMEAIAASLGSRSSSEVDFHALTVSLQQQHEETRQFQATQLQQLRDILVQRTNQN